MPQSFLWFCKMLAVLSLPSSPKCSMELWSPCLLRCMLSLKKKRGAYKIPRYSDILVNSLKFKFSNEIVKPLCNEAHWSKCKIEVSHQRMLVLSRLQTERITDFRIVLSWSNFSIHIITKEETAAATMTSLTQRALTTICQICDQIAPMVEERILVWPDIMWESWLLQTVLNNSYFA